MTLVKLAVAVLAAAASLGLSAAVDPECDGNYVDNPFDPDTKSCGCKGQIYVAEECSKGFWCYDENANNGCLTECGADEVVEGRARTIHTKFSVRGRMNIQ